VRLSRPFRGLSPSRLHNPAPAEIVARFILSRSHFTPESSRVNPRALEPSRQDNATSVFRTHDLDEDRIWLLGRDAVAVPRGRPLYGRADMNSQSIRDVGLLLVSNEPPPRHALITGWPPDKHAAMSKAQELAARATLVLNPSPAAA
jgi:hypothetical protein